MKAFENCPFCGLEMKMKLPLSTFRGPADRSTNDCPGGCFEADQNEKGELVGTVKGPEINYKMSVEFFERWLKLRSFE